MLNEGSTPWDQVNKRPQQDLNVPEARHSHSIVANSDFMLMFGGAIDIYDSAIADLWKFDFSSNAWIDITPNDTNQAPYSRSSSSLISFHRNLKK